MTKKEIATVELKKPTFANRMKLLDMFDKDHASETIAQWACQGLYGCFIDELNEEQEEAVGKYSNEDIIALGTRAIEEFGNPKSGSN